jgi:hypothetical protein
MEYFGDSTDLMREVSAAPYASALIEGHRDFGYNLETALADIIDNSITAGANRVDLIAKTTVENPYIAIADNGSGMSELELIEAMRLGSKNPNDVRATNDLGRFGLGLKSSSFSQCRKLTVLTRKDGHTSCACWDLDRVSRNNNWMLVMVDNPEKVSGYGLLSESGTVIVWEQLDRLINGFGEDNVKRINFLNSELVKSEQHLSLVFHRFIEGTNPTLSIFLNSRRIKAIDPMAATHPSTQIDPDESLRLSKGNVFFRCYTLPHHKKMTIEEWNDLGGSEGHLRSQGLYIYRENRLIISGGWLGLTRQTELTKLCRIAVDIPNTMDAEWKIDVKKASAQLPPLVRERLKRIVERFVGTSKRTYRSRGYRLVDEQRHPLWHRTQKDGQVYFSPNLDHPVFSSFAEKLPEDLYDGFQTCLRLLGSGLPIEALHAELVGNAEAVTADSLEEVDLKCLVDSLAASLLENGVGIDALPDTMQSNPFLRANWAAATRLLEDFLRKKSL